MNEENIDKEDDVDEGIVLMKAKATGSRWLFMKT